MKLETTFIVIIAGNNAESVTNMRRQLKSLVHRNPQSKDLHIFLSEMSMSNLV